MEGLGAHISMGALKKVTKDQLYYGVDPDYLLWTVSREKGQEKFYHACETGVGVCC